MHSEEKNAVHVQCSLVFVLFALYVCPNLVSVLRNIDLDTEYLMKITVRGSNIFFNM